MSPVVNSEDDWSCRHCSVVVFLEQARPVLLPTFMSASRGVLVKIEVCGNFHWKISGGHFIASENWR